MYRDAATTSGWSRRRLLTSAAGIAAGVMAVPVAGARGALAQTRLPAVTDWVRRHATPLDTIDPTAPPADLAPLRRSIGHATIVGLGESVHGTAEESELKHRTLRMLVEQLGFRSIAWEEQWTTGLLVDEYIRGGDGDLAGPIGRLGFQWQTREVADLLRWLREFNAGRADKVRFFGVEFYFLGLAAYDAIEDHVARTAPERLAELQGHLNVVRPATADIQAHIERYTRIPNKQPIIRHARQVRELVESLPHCPGDRDHAVTLHHARQIVFFYEHYSLPETAQDDYRDAHAAWNLRWWREFSGDDIGYWAASPHMADAPRLHIFASEPELRFASVGSFLRRWYGQGYRSIGFTFDHGTVSLGFGGTATMPPPEPDWFEQPFGAVGLDQFAVDLRAPAPPEVRRWLDAPVKTRGLPNFGPASFVEGGTLAEWFDIVIHRQQVSPALPA
jgi:erythromycin esterase-like protein